MALQGGAAPWKRLSPVAMVYGVLFLGALTVWPSLHSLARYWRDVPDYGHGMLLAPGVLVWLFLLRGELARYAPRPQPWALPLLCAALLAWLVAFRGNSALGHQLLVPPVLWLAVWAACGPALAARVAPPLAWFYFAIPIWEYLVPVLQHITVAVTDTILRLLEIPAVVDGIHVNLPAGSFEIAEGCAGQRYFVVTLTFASLAGIVTRLRWQRFILLMVSAAAMALVANWLRVLIVILAGHVTHMQHYWVAVEHFSLGWMIFAVLLVAIALLVRRLSRHDTRDRSAAAAAVPAATSAVAKFAAPIAVILLLLVTQVLRSTDPVSSSSPRLGDLPVLAGNWQGPLPASSAWEPHFVAASHEARAAYRSDAATVEVYLNVYGRQTPGAELVFYQNTVAAPAGERWVVESEYLVGGHATQLEPVAQLLYGVKSLTRATPSGVLAFAARCDAGDCDAARQALANFKNEYGRALLALIPSD